MANGNYLTTNKNVCKLGGTLALEVKIFNQDITLKMVREDYRYI
jgi:hypothetical protein